MSEVGGPIADLSYRDYTGPISKSKLRWWVISKMMTKQVFKKKGYWISTAITFWYYVVLMAILFYQEMMMQNIPEGAKRRIPDLLTRLIWKDQFLNTFQQGQLLYMIIILMVGAGSIANDNRANALLVYLSKPISKLDYLLGKWLGTALPLFAAMILPHVFFFLYGAISYNRYGFLSADPTMFLRVIAACAVTSLTFSAIITGISSMFKSGMAAGGLYAGLYLVLQVFGLINFISFVAKHSDENRILLTGGQYIMANISIDGFGIAIFKAIMGTDGSPAFAAPQRRDVIVGAPPLLAIMTAVVIVIGLFLGLAYKRIRAVEVV